MGSCRRLAAATSMRSIMGVLEAGGVASLGGGGGGGSGVFTTGGVPEVDDGSGALYPLLVSSSIVDGLGARRRSLYCGGNSTTSSSGGTFSSSASVCIIKRAGLYGETPAIAALRCEGVMAAELFADVPASEPATTTAPSMASPGGALPYGRLSATEPGRESEATLYGFAMTYDDWLLNGLLCCCRRFEDDGRAPTPSAIEPSYNGYGLIACAGPSEVSGRRSTFAPLRRDRYGSALPP